MAICYLHRGRMGRASRRETLDPKYCGGLGMHSVPAEHYVLDGVPVRMVPSRWMSRTAQPTPLCYLSHGFADLWISIVLQVLSAAWQMFSSGHSAHFGLRAMQSARPCHMTW